MEIETDRLILRSWRESGLEPFFRLNADPKVMEFFPKTLNRIESDEFIGTTGIFNTNFDSHFTPSIEIGFSQLGFSGIVAITTTLNVRSRHVLYRLGKQDWLRQR